MAKRTLIEALNDLLQDLMDSEVVFGGKVVVLGGDFRQTLPVVSKASKSETIAACLTNSKIWSLLCQLQLQQNMRALLDPVFTDFLLRVGDGRESIEDDDLVTIPTSMLIRTDANIDSLNVLIDHVYPNINEESTNIPSNLNHAILTTTNTFVDEINDVLIGKFPGEEVEYVSFDETLDPNDQAHYEDFLHSLTPNVLENGHVHLTKKGNQLKKLLLIDSQGTKVTALIFDSQVQALKNTLKPFRRYYISNAFLTKTEEHYRVSSYPLSWSLYSSTLIEGYPETIPPTLPCQFHFTPFSELYMHAETNNFQNIRGIVLRCFASHEQDEISHETGEPMTKRDIVIVNEEKKLMLVTLWNAFDGHEGSTLEKIIDTTPIIFGMRLKVTTFNGLSLGTLAGSAILINPPVTENQELQNWYNENKIEVLQMLEEKAYRNTDLLLPYPRQEDIISIARATESLTTHKTAWVGGKLNLPKQDRTFSHTGCANCMKPIDADITWIVTCPSCKIQTEVQLISRATVELNDGTGVIRGVISTPDIEKFISLSPQQVRDIEEYEKNLHQIMATGIQSKAAVFFVCSYQITHKQQTTKRLVFVKAYKVEANDVQPNQTKEKIVELQPTTDVQTHTTSKPPVNVEKQKALDMENQKKKKANTHSQPVLPQQLHKIKLDNVPPEPTTDLESRKRKQQPPSENAPPAGTDQGRSPKKMN